MVAGGTSLAVLAVVIVFAVIAINSRGIGVDAGTSLTPVGVSVSSLDSSTADVAFDKALKEAAITISDDDEVETVSNADGSVTKKITHADGTTTEVTVKADGSTKVSSGSSSTAGTSGNSSDESANSTNSNATGGNSGGSSGNNSSGTTGNSGGGSTGGGNTGGGSGNTPSTPSTPDSSSGSSSSSSTSTPAQAFDGNYVAQQVTSQTRGFMTYIQDLMTPDEIATDPSGGMGYFTMNYAEAWITDPSNPMFITQEEVIADIVGAYQAEKNLYGNQYFYIEYRGLVYDSVLMRNTHLFYCHRG